jgi:hypothetical protein
MILILGVNFINRYSIETDNKSQHICGLFFPKEMGLFILERFNTLKQ